MSGPYASAVDAYWSAGWRGVLPLPEGAKKWPPKGYTGGGGIDPSYPDVRTWADGKEGRGNVGLRLPYDVIGIDVDDYDDKPGGKTLASAEKSLGKLPATWRTTSRDDGVSGIRLFRVPPGLAWDQIGPGIETIQRNHRYCVVWPSVHPDTGKTYRWIDPSAVVSTVIPSMDELPSLPQAWIDRYAKGEAADIPRNEMPATLAAAWLAGLDGAAADPCRRMREAATSDTLSLQQQVGSAHDLACQATGRFVRLAAEGHPGVLRVMGSVHKAFVDNVTNARRQGKHVRAPLEAESEWRELVVSAVNLVSADAPESPSCDCSGGLTALIVPDATRTSPTQPDPAPTNGTSALAPQPDTDETPDDTTDTDETRTSWWPRDLGPVISGEQTEPPPTVLARNDGRHLWYSSKINGLIGESESGKTWVALLGVAQQLGQAERVLYLDFEDAAPGIVGRLRALGVDGDDILTWLDYCDPAESLSVAASGDLGELLRDRRYSLIVVDGFNAAMTLLGLDLMSNTDVTKFFQLLLRPLAKTGAAVAYIDHIGKNAGDDSKGGIGAQAKRAMTTGCVLKVKVGDPFGRGMTGRLHMNVDKDRAGHVRGIAEHGRGVGTAVLTSEVSTGAVGVVIEPADSRSTHERQGDRRAELMEAVSLWLETSPEQTSKNAARKAVEGRGVDIESALDDLVIRGFAYRSKVGSGYTHHSVRPFRTTDLVPSSGVVPTSSGTRGPGPSIDLVPSSHLYRWDEDESSEAGVGQGVPVDNSAGRTPEASDIPRGSTLDCNSCGRPFAARAIVAHKGYCVGCAKERGIR